MKKQFNNELININKLEKGKTGNADLDNAFADMNSTPLIFTSEEASYLVDNAMVNDVTSSVIKNTIILGGAVLVSAIFGWMYYQYNSNHSTTTIVKKNQKNKEILFEQNKIKLSSSNENPSSSTEENNNSTVIVNQKNSTIESKEDLSTTNTFSNQTSNVNSKVTVGNANTNHTTTPNKSSSVIIKNNTEPSIEDSKKSNSNFSKTIITQRYFDDGSAKMTLEYKNQPARITINSRGIESLFINSEEVDPAYYYLYDDLATEAFKRAKIEPLALPTSDANAKPNISAMMTGALVRRGLIKSGDKFNFELTSSTATLNNTNLKSDIQKDLLQVYQNAFGSSMPRGGKFIIAK